LGKKHPSTKKNEKPKTYKKKPGEKSPIKPGGKERGIQNKLSSNRR